MGIDENDFRDQMMMFQADPAKGAEISNVRQVIMEGNYTLKEGEKLEQQNYTVYGVD